MKKKQLLLILFIFFTILFIYKYNDKKEEKINESKISLLIKQRLAIPRTTITNSLLKSPPSFTLFKDSFKEAQFENLTMIGKVGKWGVEGDEGKILRTLRFKNITDSIENRYNLPPYILLAMMAQESGGADLLPNGLDDGGFGLCHMQPSIAGQFGLQVFGDCKKLVCKEHGRALRGLLESLRYTRKQLVLLDQRLHPILNLDAVARMLTVHGNRSRVKGLGPFRTALCRYAGAYNYREYWQNVKRFIKRFEDSSYIQMVARDFNTLNPDLKINGVPANFETYISTCQQQNFNYGLAEYSKQAKYLPASSIEILNTYIKFL